MLGDYVKVGKLCVNLKLLLFTSHSVLLEVRSSVFISLTLSKVSSFSFICGMNTHSYELHFPMMTSWRKEKEPLA